MSVPDRGATPDKPDLMWTPEISATIDQWQATGIFPFPSLQVYATPDPSLFSADDLRLIHHVASICDELETLGVNNFTLWTRQIPT